ncbi:MAG: hypothetical protein FWH01_09785 [Oscillospiraceae bacterium]|nr:hypothetical protein [Oscillospiraceae bacterium]
MYPVNIVYSVDGYSDEKIEVGSFIDLKSQLLKIKEDTAEMFSAPFSVDVQVEAIGFMSIGLADDTILCYKSWDLENQLTSVRDLSANGNISFYFGDYTLMSKKYLISYDLALDVLNDWILTGELNDKVLWTAQLFN